MIHFWKLQQYPIFEARKIQILWESEWKEKLPQKLNCFASEWRWMKLVSLFTAVNRFFSILALLFIWCKVFSRNFVIAMPNMKVLTPKLTSTVTTTKTYHRTMLCRINAMKNPISVFGSNGYLWNFEGKKRNNVE